MEQKAGNEQESAALENLPEAGEQENGMPEDAGLEGGGAESGS